MTTPLPSIGSTSVLAAPSDIVREAFYVPGQQEPLFAWLHRCRGAEERGHAVLICAPAGCEQVHAHRSLRHLADRLAAAGFLAVRFDYVGTGDSGDAAEGAPLYPAWVANTRDVLAWMRDRLGAGPISMMGLRLGAALASQVAAEQAIDTLILWEPIVRGRGYARELKALSMMAGPSGDAAASANGDIEAAGFVFPRQLVDAIGQIDLLTVAPKCRRALILCRDDAAADGKLQQHLTSLGIEAEQGPLPGYADMMTEPHFSKVPADAITRTVDWLATASGANHQTNGAGIPEPTAAPLPGLGIIERVVCIGPAPHLFGILTEPAQPTNLPVIILPNAGSAYHVGPGRLYVTLARRLACIGFRCLRIDVSTLGDSVLGAVAGENDCYAASSFQDIDCAIHHAQEELGASRILVMGLCSGAYFAFQAAAQIDNPAFVECVLINPLTYFWKDSMTLENSPAQEHARFHYYKSAALQPRKWLKLLAGGTKIGILGGLKLLRQRLRLGRSGSAPVAAAPLGHPAQDDVAGDLERIRRAGRHIACFFARNDPGYSLLTASAGSKVNELTRAGVLAIHFVDNADHTFSRQSAREAFLGMIARYLADRYRS